MAVVMTLNVQALLIIMVGVDIMGWMVSMHLAMVTMVHHVVAVLVMVTMVHHVVAVVVMVVTMVSKLPTGVIQGGGHL